MKNKKRLTLHEKAFLALKEAIAGVVERHRKSGRPLAIWRDGKVVLVSANECLRRQKNLK